MQWQQHTVRLNRPLPGHRYPPIVYRYKVFLLCMANAKPHVPVPIGCQYQCVSDCSGQTVLAMAWLCSLLSCDVERPCRVNRRFVCERVQPVPVMSYHASERIDLPLEASLQVSSSCADVECPEW
jgi:hypothetical protein